MGTTIQISFALFFANLYTKDKVLVWLEATMKKHIYVVGAVIVENGKILCAQRNTDTTLPLLWEFPGGKIEPGETPENALKREIKEELSCEIAVGKQVDYTVYEYDFGIVHLTTFLCRLIEGTPIRTEHEMIKWLKPGELTRLDWAPADIPTVDKLMKGLIKQD